MRFPFKYFAIFITLMLSVLSHSTWAGDKQEKELKFVADVLFHSQIGPDRKFVRKRKNPMKIWIHSTSNSWNRRMALKITTILAIHNIEYLTNPRHISIKLVKNKKEANVYLVFAPRLSFYDLAREYNVNKDWYDWSNYFNFPPDSASSRQNSEIKHSILFITDEFHDSFIWKPIALGILHALGLNNSSPVFKNSIFFMDRGHTNKNSEYSLEDKKVIRFLYQYLKAGDDQKTMKEKFYRYWN